MTDLRRTVRIRGAPMQTLDLQTICDKFDRSRAHGNHTKCSKRRLGLSGQWCEGAKTHMHRDG